MAGAASDPRLRSSITEGVVVFLVAVRRQSRGPSGLLSAAKRLHGDPLREGEPRPLEPIEALIESGTVIALNFPVAHESWSGSHCRA